MKAGQHVATTVVQQHLDRDLDLLREVALRYGLEHEADNIAVRKRDSQLGLMVLVAGAGNYGKSSLINALAGKDIADVSILPKTFKVDVYRQTQEAEEFAILRKIGQTEGRRLTIDAAKAICSSEEEELEQAARKGVVRIPEIVEVIWNRTGLALGPNICLVDTPGLAQFGLSGSTISESLVKGLGATYTVDEVWAMWYFRADVAVWAFQSNAMEDRETFNTLSTLLALYHKSIIPVATKADLIPQERWGEIESRFNTIYGDPLREHAHSKLVLTVAGGRTQLRGTGIQELSQTLHSLSSSVVERKREATQSFIQDTSEHLERILTHSANQLVRNLRTIADSADEIALFGMNQTEKAIERARQHSWDYLQGKRSGLNSMVLAMYRDFRNENQLLVDSRNVIEFLQLSHVGAIVNECLQAVGDNLKSYADSVCHTKQLERVTIGASGREMRQTFQMHLQVRPPNVIVNISDPNLPTAKSSTADSVTFRPPTPQPPGGCCMVLTLAVMFGIGVGSWQLIVIFGMISGGHR